MAINTNLTFSLRALAGQSAPTDAVTSQTLTLTGGTLTLVNDGTYGYLWRLVGGYIENAALTGQGQYGETMAKTIALRMRISSRAAAFSRFLTWGTDTNNGLLIGNNGSGTGALRAGVYAGGGVLTALTAADVPYTNDAIITLVLRMQSGATDQVDVWIKTTGRSGTAADRTLTNAFTFGALAALDTLRITAAAGETVDLLDFAAWDRAVTDAEGAALADDVRTTLDTVPDATLPTLSGSVTISSITTSGATATWPAGADNIAVTSYETSLDGTTWTDRGNVLTYNFSGLAAGTAYTVYVRAKDAAGNVSTPAITGAFTTSVAAATATTLSGPSGGTVGSASAPFTVGLNGTGGPVTITPSDGGAGGTFSPTSVTVTYPATATFTYTAASAGAKTISTTNGSALSNPATITYTASATAGTLTGSVLKNNTGTVLASMACEAYVSNPTTGALVVKKTGLTTSGAGVPSFSDATLSAGTSYRVVWRTTVDGAEGLETLTAS